MVDKHLTHNLTGNFNQGLFILLMYVLSEGLFGVTEGLLGVTDLAFWNRRVSEILNNQPIYIYVLPKIRTVSYILGFKFITVDTCIYKFQLM